MTTNITPTIKWSKPEFKRLGRLYDVAGPPGVGTNGAANGHS